MTTNSGRRVVRLLLLSLVAMLSLAMLLVVLPRLLVVDNAVVSDYIVVLDGHDRNYYAGLELLRRGFGRRMFVCLDLPDTIIQGEERSLDLEFIHKTAGGLAEKIDLCTNESDEDLTVVLRDRASALAARRVLLVTPERVSRAQLITFKRQLPQFSWTVEAVKDEDFDMRWWHCRRWTKAFLSSLVELGQALRTPPASSPPIERSSE